MGRQPGALRYFRLSDTASAAELRREYLRRVKMVHPDITGSSTDSFLELQQNFNEATLLLNRRTVSTAYWQREPMYQRPPWEPSWEPPHARASSSRGTTTAAAGFGQQAGPTANTPTAACTLAAVSLFSAVALPFWLLKDTGSSSSSTAQLPKMAGGRDTYAVQHAASWPSLESGPWSVADARASSTNLSANTFSAQQSRENPQNDSFYLSRAKGCERACYKQPQLAVLGEWDKPVLINGLKVLPVHAAARNGSIWWLERCGANPTCRRQLETRDVQGNTALHHAAMVGNAQVCSALMRLGSTLDVCNNAGQTPAASARLAGHADAAAVLKGATADLVAPTSCLRHPDGCGILAEPPPSIVFPGLRETGCLQRAVNMAAGCTVVPPVPASRAIQEEAEATNIVRGCLQDTEFDLVEMASNNAAVNPWLCQTEGTKEVTVGELCGLLLYEPAGVVSEDAPGHWFAIRCHLSGGAGADEGTVTDYGSGLWRLDPVRGAFRLSHEELTELMTRYRSWFMLRGSTVLRSARLAELAAARSEATSLVQHSCKAATV